MKICFVVNNVDTETAGSTVYITHEARKRNHEVYLMGVGDFSFTQNEALSINSIYLPNSTKVSSPEEHLEQLQGKKGKKKKIVAADLDVLFKKKLEYKNHYGPKISNRELATMA